ncbi:MAG: acyl-CoA dehydrogenase [Rhodospirillaceae bacterium]|jgi:acyl-CoA dehydrogenase|nr:acyl-CoA dehydrogenase [Rhodospirillaceae bacterium]MBT4043832.1 acyl-CoA dehydrogenase [Rhodospirillaceae bacterium]MBT4691153.1 acyl-CoA dehydrogenase [Rhodospirillaceae bacterium]MBT5080894.1 acyl-CoA dehydrogenase [Rhodospirillaceae bacterium]MBT5525315.1 acyl-CoA dehydrogenase [Rhodospirillaceae bacterium]
MDEAQSLVADAASRIFRDLGDPQTINSAGNGMADDSWRAPLWQALEESGLTTAWVSDELGGAGAGIGAGFAVLRVAGEFAAALPLAETLLGGWLLEQGGIVLPGGSLSVAPTRRGDTITLNADGTLSGSARAVSFAAEVDHLVVLAGDIVALVDRADCSIQSGSNMAGEALNHVDFTGVTPQQTAAVQNGIDTNALIMMGAAARSMQMAGALQTVLEIAVQYAEERVAFGKPIAKFQAVQHNLARLGEEAAAAIAIASSTAYSVENLETWQDPGLYLDIASAKIRVGEAAGEGGAIGHQAFGAIGFTQEHILHRFVQRLWSWRDDFDNEAVWAVELGRRVAAKGGESLWHSLTAA